MDASDACQDLQRRIGALFTCSEHGDYHHLVARPEGLTFVSLFDDTADVWADEDFRLVEPLSMVSRWSRPDEFAAVLSAAG